MAITNDVQQRQIKEKLNTIDEIRNAIEKEVIKQSNAMLEKHHATIDSWMKDRQKMIDILNDMRNEKNAFTSLCTYYLKSPPLLRDNINRLKISHMKQFAELFGHDFSQ